MKTRKPYVDPAKQRKEFIFLSYVRSKYIGTVGCPPSLTLYGKWLNRSKGFKPVLLAFKLLHNIAKGAFTRASGEKRGNSLC